MTRVKITNARENTKVVLLSTDRFHNLAYIHPEEFLDAGVTLKEIESINKSSTIKSHIGDLGTRLYNLYHPRARAENKIGATVAIIKLDKSNALIVMDEHDYEILPAAKPKMIRPLRTREEIILSYISRPK